MVLTSEEIENLNLVENAQSAGKRATTYDATVGDIINNGKTINDGSYVLPPRGMAWVVSNERFKIPPNVTGLATLRTTWTHKGILALNVGIIDPGWNGPLATALVNFSDTNFEFNKQDAFMRVIFMRHEQTGAAKTDVSRLDYLREIRSKSSAIPSEFLKISSLATQILDQFVGSGIVTSWIAKAGVIIGLIAIPVGFASIFAPIAFTVWGDQVTQKADLKTVQSAVTKLEQ